MAFINLALFEIWQFVPTSSNTNGENSFKPKVMIFVALGIHYRVRFLIVENLQHILCTEKANKSNQLTFVRY